MTSTTIHDVDEQGEHVEFTIICENMNEYEAQMFFHHICEFEEDFLLNFTKLMTRKSDDEPKSKGKSKGKSGKTTGKSTTTGPLLSSNKSSNKDTYISSSGKPFLHVH